MRTQSVCGPFRVSVSDDDLSPLPEAWSGQLDQAKMHAPAREATGYATLHAKSPRTRTRTTDTFVALLHPNDSRFTNNHPGLRLSLRSCRYHECSASGTGTVRYGDA